MKFMTDLKNKDLGQLFKVLLKYENANFDSESQMARTKT